MSIPFSKIYARVDAKGYRHIVWSLDSSYEYPEDCILSIQYSRAGAQDPQWITLMQNVGDSCQFIDYQRRNYNKKLNDYYRAVLTCPSTGQVYKSQSVHAGDYMPGADSAQLNNLVRLTQLQINKTGRAGVLLKKRVWGQRCPRCTHFDYQDSVNEHCPVCLGTGIKGGYYKGIPMGILQNQTQQAQRVGPYGYEQAQIISAKCVAWPWIHLGDVWVDSVTNDRYYISGANVLSKHRHVPIVYQLQLKLLQLTDVIHSDQADQKLIQAGTQFIQTNDTWLKDDF